MSPIPPLLSSIRPAGSTRKTFITCGYSPVDKVPRRRQQPHPLLRSRPLRLRRLQPRRRQHQQQLRGRRLPLGFSPRRGLALLQHPGHRNFHWGSSSGESEISDRFSRDWYPDCASEKRKRGKIAGFQSRYQTLLINSRQSGASGLRETRRRGDSGFPQVESLNRFPGLPLGRRSDRRRQPYTASTTQ